MATPPPVTAAFQAAVESSFDVIPECAYNVGGFCTETNSKGTIVYDDFQTCSGSFLNLPGINLLPDWLLAVMWGLFLFWLFFGVAVVSDAFVGAIDVITSATKTVQRIDTNGNTVYRQEPVWNWAVANITLLAVGSSSPEILLSLIETLLTLNQPAGEIGPSTIIGSGAYNLFVILAVCTLSMPRNVFKRVEHTKVFWWTTTWSMWAQLWLWLVYTRISPDVIDVWEACVTIAFMPVFVLTTYLVDTRGFNWFKRQDNKIVPADDDEIEAGKSAVDVDVDSTAGARAEPPKQQYHSILYYRTKAVQMMAGGGKANWAAPQLKMSTAEFNLDATQIDSMDKHIPKVLTREPTVSVLENAGEAHVEVVRMHGDPDQVLHVEYRTQDDTAVAGLDYDSTRGTLVFEPGVNSRDITIKVNNDDMSEPDVLFHVVLTSAQVVGGGRAKILRHQTDVTIIDDDDSGTLTFELPNAEAGVEDQHAEVEVVRRKGSDGAVTVDYATKDGTAAAGRHYKAVSGTLEFKPGQTRQVIQVPLLPVSSAALDGGMLAFRVTLSNATQGAVLGARTECRVVMLPGSKLGKMLGIGSDASSDVPDIEEKNTKYDLWGEWAKKFQFAILPTYDREDGPMWQAMLLHYMSITFKALAACTPPAEWKGGYPSFIAALGLLGGLMAIVKEVAQMFGCACGLSDVMTGMSIVALGTSLPDTFASRYAALNDPYADAAIGNIMGSNSVNVFLGLGVPWTVASVYYEVRGTRFDVFAGALGFSVMIFFICAAIALAFIVLRRSAGGELGGSLGGQVLSFSVFFGLWLAFLVVAGLYDYEHIPDFGI